MSSVVIVIYSSDEVRNIGHVMKQIDKTITCGCSYDNKLSEKKTKCIFYRQYTTEEEADVRALRESKKVNQLLCKARQRRGLMSMSVIKVS